MMSSLGTLKELCTEALSNDHNVLSMDVQADEDDCMASMGYIFEQHPHLQGCELAVSPRVSAELASESIKMLFMFNQLRQLQLRFDFDDIIITQQMVCSIAELLQLFSLHLLHGGLGPDVDLSHWSSLRSLAELKLLPGEEGGLNEQQVAQLTGLSSSLTSLALRPQPQEFTLDSMYQLASITQLQDLSLCPLPEGCTAPGLQQLLDMPQLTRLQLGTNDAAQVLLLTDVKVPQRSPQLSLLVRDACEPCPAADVLTVIGWTLPAYLTALSIGPLAAPSPNDVLVTVATLTNLQSLQLQLVAPPGQHVSGTVELLTLSTCRQLTCLEVLTSSRLYCPFTIKTVSLATLAWPNLAALRLSLAGRRELMPEALTMCDNFTALKELQLFSPLEDTPLEDLQTQLSTGAAEATSSAIQSGWAGWAAAGLGSLFSGGGISNGNSANQQSSASGTRRMSADSGLARSGSGVSGPLAQDLHQRGLVQQAHWKQHEAAHPQHMQDQRSLQDSMSAHSHNLACSTLQDRQLLPAAVRSLQRHKLTRADSLFGGKSSSSKEGEQATVDSNDAWLPKWLLRSFVPFGQPASDSSTSAANSPMAQQRRGSWGLLDACRGSLPSTTSAQAGEGLCPNLHVHSTASRLQHTSSAALEAAPSALSSLRRTATISGHGSAQAAELRPALQRRASSPSVSAPGLEGLGMYRASGLLLPLNLSYMPKSLSKLCLQSYHLTAMGMQAGMPCAGNVTSTAGDSVPTGKQPQMQDDRSDSAQEGHPGGADPCAGATAGTAHAETAAATGHELEQLPPQADDAPTAAQAIGRTAVTDAGVSGTALVSVQTAAQSAGGACGGNLVVSKWQQAGSSMQISMLPKLPLPHLLHLELDTCRIDDATMTALLRSSPALRTLEIAGLEGLTDAGLSQVSSLQHLTRLCVEAEDTTGISLASLSAVRRLHSLKKLHWCSRDSLHGPLDTDLLTAQLSGLTGLRQLVLLVAPDSEAYVMSGWRIVLQRRLPLCRLVLRRELLTLDAWSDIPEEGVL